MNIEYTLEELLAVQISHRISDDDVVGFVGLGTGGRAYIQAVGAPSVGARLAQLTHAPNFIMNFGPIIDVKIDDIDTPQTNFENDLIDWPCRAMMPAFDNLNIFKSGKMGIGFVSAPQIDKYGNTNIVAIGDYLHPKVRLVGALAHTDHFTYAKKVMGIFHQSKRSFIEKVDFVTGAGHNNRDGLPGGGLRHVFTQYGIMGFDEAGLMYVDYVHPFSSADEIRANTGFDIIIPEVVKITPDPTEEELRLIREVIDPNKKYLSAGITLEEASLID